MGRIWERDETKYARRLVDNPERGRRRSQCHRHDWASRRTGLWKRTAERFEARLPVGLLLRKEYARDTNWRAQGGKGSEGQEQEGGLLITEGETMVENSL